MKKLIYPAAAVQPCFSIYYHNPNMALLQHGTFLDMRHIKKARPALRRDGRLSYSAGHFCFVTSWMPTRISTAPMKMATVSGSSRKMTPANMEQSVESEPKEEYLITVMLFTE